MKKQSTPNFKPDTFAARLRGRMAEVSLRQTDVAKALTVAQGSVSGWLRGGNIPHRRTLSLLAQSLAVTPEWLLTGTQPKFSEGRSEAGANSYVRIFFRLHSEHRAAQVELPQRVRWLREQLGLSVREFARRIGYAPSYVSRLENAKRLKPSWQFEDALIEAFGIDRRWTDAGTAPPVFRPKSHALRAVNSAWSSEKFTRYILQLAELMATNELSTLLQDVLDNPEAMRKWRKLAPALAELLSQKLKGAKPSGDLTRDQLYRMIEIVQGEAKQIKQ